MNGKLFRIALALTVSLTVGGVHRGLAQDDALLSPFEPSLGLAMPLTQGDAQVLVAQKFLLNETVIISAGDQIRVIFPRPEVKDKDVRRKQAVQSMESYVSQNRLNVQEEDVSQSALYRAALDRATKSVWKDEMKFRVFLDRMNLDNDILVFQRPGAEHLTVDTFSFPQDLFLGEANGQVIVLAVRKKSQSQKLGIRAGAVLTAINGKPLANLEAFRDLYFQERQNTQEQPLTMTFILPGETTPKEIAYPRARSLSSNLLMSDWPISPSGTSPANNE